MPIIVLNKELAIILQSFLLPRFCPIQWLLLSNLDCVHDCNAQDIIDWCTVTGTSAVSYKSIKFCKALFNQWMNHPTHTLGNMPYLMLSDIKDLIQSCTVNLVT